MSGDWPSTDTRRASKLREEIESSAPMLAPEWAGLTQQGDFGRALVEIAARLAEHSTSRLDRTALRDKLAFLDALDVATPPPQSATVPIVFTLAEKRETPVFAPPRVKLSAEGEKEEIDFETREALSLTPARLVALIAADPAADRIESAPAFVTGGLAEPAPPTRYMLLSAVEAKARSLQLVQAVGIQPDDLLRLGGTAYRVEKAEGTIVQLRDPLLASAPAEAEVEKLLALEAFDLRDLQEHAAYVGHKELLKLDGPAQITLVFDPPTLPSRLAGLDVAYQMWGTDKDDAEPAWHPLELLGAGRDGLRLAKDWEGAVDELELAGRTSRWIRLRLKTPITGACGPPTSTVSVELKVESAAPNEPAEGSRTVAAAFYNGQPLPTSSAFFPFGAEPQRFDIFALSAPEALSKKGARVTLQLRLDDASLNAMAYAADDPGHVYGVSANGRLQSVRFAEPKAPDWRQLGLAPEEDGAGAAADASVRLEAGAPLYALHIDASQDLVFVRDANGLIRSARVDSSGDSRAVGEWRSHPAADGKAFLGFCLLPAPAAQQRANDGIAARLVAVAADALYVRNVVTGGRVAGAWTRVESGLALAEPVAIVPAAVRAGSATLALVDAAGKIHRGEYGFAANRVVWTAFPAPPAEVSADPAIRPVAWLEGPDLLVLAARATSADPSAAPLLLMDEKLGEVDLPVDDLRVRLGRPHSLLAVDWTDADAPDRPLIAVTGTAGILIWGPGQAEIADLPGEARPDNPYGLLLPAGTDRLPSLVVNGGSELLLHAKIRIGTMDVEVKLHDALWRIEGGTEPTHVLIQKSAPPKPLPGPWLSNDLQSAHVAPSGLDPGDEYVLLEKLADSFTGTARDPNNPKEMPLVAGDDVTAAFDFLEIDGKTFEVTDLSGSPKVATMDRTLPVGSLAYQIYRPTEMSAGIFASGDRLRIAELDNDAPLGADQLVFPAPADPERQPIVDATGKWLLLGEEWLEDPGSDSASLTSEPHLEPPAQIRLPRLADNPDLSWEYFDGDGWRRLDSEAKWGFTDGTLNLARSGDIGFDVPRDLSQTEIAGKEDYWIRARLVGGDYGRPAYVITNDPSPPDNTSRTSITIDRSRLNPPEILSIEATYVLRDAVPPDGVIADNNLAAIDQSQAALEGGAVFNLFEGVAQHVGDPDGGTRALYLGFGRQPGVAALNLYADAIDRDSAPRELLAEVLTRDGWRPIGADDETAALTRPGMLRLYLHPPPEQLPLFGRDGWWFRLRPGTDATEWAPMLRGLFVNAVIAEHAKSVAQELLGSSLGEPDQSYRLAHTPILPATLELRVLESLGGEEQEAIEKKSGNGAIKDEDPNLPGQWVLWKRVDTFVDQGGDARVYRLDPASGEIRFGNGRNGKIPPAARDSIRAFSYQKGGGSTGNVAARAIDNLSSAIESVEQAINPVESAGGADAPRVERLATTAPALLRHAGRALAPADIEALAVGSAPDVVRARCLARKGCSIALAVVIRATGVRCPAPTRARREGIARNIVAAGWGALAPDAVTVHPPRYVHVIVDAVVMATSAEAVAGVDRDVRAALAAYLHPVEGGPGGLGWPFGRRVWPSDLQHAIARVEGLDRVVSLKLAAKDPNGDLDAMPPDGLVCVEESDIGLVVEPPEDRG